MAVLDQIFASPLSVRLIPNVAPELAAKLNLKPEQRSIGLITADNDDATYVSIDEATKMAEVEVVYARSFYAGARHASGPLSGEIMAILAGPDPAEVRAGLQAAVQYMKTEAIWYAGNADGSIAFFPHVISRTGSYLAKTCEVPLGAPLHDLVDLDQGGGAGEVDLGEQVADEVEAEEVEAAGGECVGDSGDGGELGRGGVEGPEAGALVEIGQA